MSTPTSPASPLRHLGVAGGALLLLVAYGTIGYMLVAHYPFLDAVFMTVITITTVGYGETHPLDGAGQLFTISVIVFGVIGFLYTFGVLVEILSSDRLQQHRRLRRMDQRLRSLRDHVIVCGHGRTGKQVVGELQEAGRTYVVVELNPDPLADADADDEPRVLGDATSDEVLQRAGIERARALVAVVDSDELNIYIVLTARSLNPSLYIVARSSFPESESKLRRAGADRVVSPYRLSGRRIAALALQPAIVDTLEVARTDEGGAVRLEELQVPELRNRELTAGDLRRFGAVLLAIRSGGGRLVVEPPDSEPVRCDDLVVAMGTRDQLDNLASELRPVPSGPP